MSFDQIPMPSFHPKSVRESGQNGTSAPDAMATPGSAYGAAAATDLELSPLLPDLSKYDLTVGEALEIFRAEHRKVPSIRTLQRYCQEGRFDCHKLKTTRNGNPVHEWIINSTSLRDFIQSRRKDDTPDAISTPAPPDDATGDAEPRVGGEKTTSAIAAPGKIDDAISGLALQRSFEDEPNATAAPEDPDDAGDRQMSRVELLIENAKLTAQLDAQSDLVGELREDKQFMREEITQHRQNDRLLADMHRETLQTLKAVAIAGRHTKIEMPGEPFLEEGSEPYRDITNSGQEGSQFDNDDV